jgi:hypothetical protein
LNPEIEAIGARSKEKAGGFSVAVGRDTKGALRQSTLFTLSRNSDSRTEGLLELQKQIIPSLISSANVVKKSFKPLVSLYISLLRCRRPIS